MIKSELLVPSFNDLTIVPGNFNLFILAIFDFDFSYINIFFAIFFLLIRLNKEEPNNPQPMIKIFFFFLILA